MARRKIFNATLCCGNTLQQFESDSETRDDYRVEEARALLLKMTGEKTLRKENQELRKEVESLGVEIAKITKDLESSIMPWEQPKGKCRLEGCDQSCSFPTSMTSFSPSKSQPCFELIS